MSRLKRILLAATNGHRSMKNGRAVDVTKMSDEEFGALVKRAPVRG